MGNNLLSKSKNCSVELEAWKSDKKSGTKGLLIGGIICVIIAVFLLFGPDSDNAKSFIGCAFMIVALVLSYFANKINKSIKSEGEYFSSLCKTEYLMVYEDRICGECAKGDLLLSINRIDSVSHLSEEHINSDCFYNDQLIVYDDVGNCYNFKSFSNARELEMTIRNLLNKGENQNEKMS